MSRETEQNISRILKDVRRHSDAGQTGFTSSHSFNGPGMTGTMSLGSFNMHSSSGSLREATGGGYAQEFDTATKWTGVEEAEEICVGMDIEPCLTSRTSLAGMTGDARASSMDCVDGSGGEQSSCAAPLFYIDNEGKGWDTIEGEMRGEERREVKQEVRMEEKQDNEELVKLNQSLKAELEEKAESNSQYKKMMVSRSNRRL